MMTLRENPCPTDPDTLPRQGTGSVAHQIIGQFISEIRKRKELTKIASALASVIYENPSEADLRAALFKDDPL
jgi:hypothetical protein